MTNTHKELVEQSKEILDLCGFHGQCQDDAISGLSKLITQHNLKTLVNEFKDVGTYAIDKHLVLEIITKALTE